VWLALLKWLPPPKLSKVGLFKGSHSCPLTTTGPLSPFFVVSLPAAWITHNLKATPTYSYSLKDLVN
jgi:hypothetical protein